MYIQKKNMSPFQLVLFLIVMGGLLVAGFFLTMALLPLILVVIAYFWYKMNKAKKAFQARYEEMQQEQHAEYQRQSRESIYSQEYSDTNFENANNAYSEQNASEGYTKLKYTQTSQKKTEETVIYDIAPEDYSIEDNK